MRVNHDVWLDIAKPALGAFIGAGLAFLSNTWFQLRQLRRERITAGNFALLILKRQLDDFYNVRRGYLRQREEVHGPSPSAPPWMHFLPMSYPFAEGVKFDFQSLAFLVETGNADVINLLAIAEGRHADLNDLASRHAALMLRIQERMESFEVPPSGEIDVEKAEAHLGRALVANGNDYTNGLLYRFREDERDYRAAIEILRNALVRKFGEKPIVRVEPVKDFEKGLASVGIVIETRPGALKVDDSMHRPLSKQQR